jgi:transcription antitermination factor NusG
MITNPTHWYVARVAPRCEFEAAAEIAEAGGITVTPSHRVSTLRRHTKSVRKIETRALLPGYLFVQAADVSTFRAARAFRGLLTNAGMPLTVPARAVDAISQQCASGTFDIGICAPATPARVWKAGEAVRVTSGLLAGMVLHVDGGRAKRGYVRFIQQAAGRAFEFMLRETLLEAA